MAPSSPYPLPRELLDRTITRLTGPGDAGARTQSPRERQELVALYGSSSLALWLDADGRVTPGARDALALLASSEAHGLRPDDYRMRDLAALAARMGPDADEDGRVRFDTWLSLHLLRYWRDLHMGRVDPRALGFRLDAPVDDHDFATLLRDTASRGRLGAATSELVPPLVLYRSLVTALDRYRALAARAEPVTLPAPATAVRPGDHVQGLASIYRLLTLVGDLPADTSPPAGDLYDGPIVEGVRRFQARHGLTPDGVLGRATVAALRVPLTTRVAQIELALERLRWLPHLDQQGFLAVNIPMFRLWVWGPVPPDGAPAFDMGVIVGRALDTRTPVFIEHMRYLVFRPYWNVPPSILRGEVLPVLATDPSYLVRNDMEIVAGPGDDARVVPWSEAALAGLRQGTLRVRQRPGPKNALGAVKFVFPNDDNIYMHGTPAPHLFGRARRDLSHGCIRLEDPVRLAEWLLRDQPQWTRERIEAAMASGPPRQVPLTRPVQVVLFYLTAVVMPEDRAVRFADDIYGHDAALARALARRVSRS